MDYSLSLRNSTSLLFSSRSINKSFTPIRRKLCVTVSSWKGPKNCGFFSLNTPLEPVSDEGKFLSQVLLDDFEHFKAVASQEIEKLALAREDAAYEYGGPRLIMDPYHDELQGRIADMKEREFRVAIQDIMYMLVLYKFKAVGVHLVPRLSTCTYKGRLEIWPCKDWELESIHSFDVLQLVREHLTAVIGWKTDTSVTANWSQIKVPRSRLCHIYLKSVMYGYFLKSASIRHRLDLNLVLTCGNPDQMSQPCSSESTDLRSYILGFDPETFKICGKLKTKEAVHLIENHSFALFGNDKRFEENEVIITSLSSLKRMILEAVAFGSFLWETEYFVSSMYMLEENIYARRKLI